MSNRLMCVMLVDDNIHDNFFHERAIKKNDLKSIVIAKTSGMDALEYIRSGESPRSDLIFLDINMPGMNGWEFLKEYKELDEQLKSRAIIIMLTTSDNPADIDKAKKWDFVADYITKPLTKETMQEIIDKYFEP